MIDFIIKTLLILCVVGAATTIIAAAIQFGLLCGHLIGRIMGVPEKDG